MFPMCQARPRFNGAATFRLRKDAAGGGHDRSGLGFNGAATFRLRKASGPWILRGPACASMGPQPFGCGRQNPRMGVDLIVCFNGAATFRLRKDQGPFGYL